MPDINDAILQARQQLGGPRGMRSNPMAIPPRLQAFAARHGMQAAQDRFAKWRAGGLPGQQVGGLTGGNTPGDNPFGGASRGGTTGVGGGVGGGNPMSGDGGMPAGGGLDYEGGPVPGGLPPPSGGIYAGGPTPAYLTKPAAMPLPFNPNGGPLTGNMDQTTGGNTMGNNPFGTTSLGGTTGVGGGAGGGVSVGADGGAPIGPGFGLGGGVGGPMIPPGGGNTTPPWSPLPGGLGPPQMVKPGGGRVGSPLPRGGILKLPKKGGSATKMKVQSGLGAMNNGALQGF